MTAFKKWLEQNSAVGISTTHKQGVITVHTLAKKVAEMSRAQLAEMRTEFRKMQKEE